MNGNIHAIIQHRILGLENEIAAEEKSYQLLSKTGKLGFISENILTKIQTLEKRKDILDKALSLMERG